MITWVDKMGIRTLFLSFLVVLFSFGAGSETAYAKKFGGGGSFGKSFSIPTKKSAPITKPAPTQNKSADTTKQNAAAAQTTNKKSGLGKGLIGGLLAGTLLGALFFGGAFDGIQLMDIIILLVIGFIAFKLFSSMRRHSQPQPATPAGTPNQERYQEQASSAYQRENQQDYSASQPSAEPVAPAYSTNMDMPAFTLPDWFNEENFIEGARGHFMTLQRAWDEHAWDEIATYTSPELLTLLKEERLRHADQQTTEVVSVLAEIVNFIDQGEQVVVSVNFYGWIKEDSDETTEFNEIWHLTRDMNVDGANWMIVGIQQPS